MIFKKQHHRTIQAKKIAFPLLAFLVLVLFAHSAKADDYFWVGGSGNWSDINHWATTSGGSVLHIQAPTATDPVFFDANSFAADDQTVTINQKNAVCLDMKWLGVSHTPTLAGNDTTSLRLYGSLYLDPAMIMAYEGTIYFEATTTGKTITSNGQTFISELIFQGNGGGWALNDDFESLNNIQLLRGDFSTNNHTLNCSAFVSGTTNPRNIHLGTSTLFLSSWQINATALELDADQSLFFIDNSFTSSDGGRLIYNIVSFTGLGGSLSSTNVYSVFNKVGFSSGNVSGTSTIDSLIFEQAGSISGSDSINYVSVGGFAHVEGGLHNIGKLHCAMSCIMEGSSVIDSVFIAGSAFIEGNHILNTVFVGMQASIFQNNSINKLTVRRQAMIAGTNQMRWAFLNGHSWFVGVNDFDTLKFTAGRTYTFGIKSITTIHQVFDAVGTCSQPIRMLSDTNGVQAVIVKNNGAFVSEYLSLRDLKAEGSIPFVAAHSVDLGNNTDWNIETTDGKDLYWVNGQGIWSDPYHWDYVSGGSGGECPPTEIDNAFFDQNSFGESQQKVIVDVNDAVCRDMNWEAVTNEPILQGSDTNNLRIYGSLYFESSISNSLQGEVFFEATEPGQIVRSANKSFLNHTWFNGRSGSWELEDDFAVNANIYFQQGGLSTNGNNVSCKIFSSTDTTTRYLSLDTSTVKLLDKSTYVWNMCGQNLSLDADSSLLMSMDAGGKIVTFAAPDPLIYHDVEFHGGGSKLYNNGAFCHYNLVTFFEDVGEIYGDCKIDTATFHGNNGSIYDSDTIKTAIFHKPNALVDGGNHVIEIAYFYDNAKVQGFNIIDTALFYRNAIILDSNYIDTAIVHNHAHLEGGSVFRTATLLGDGNIYGSHTFNDLTLSKTKSYIFENNKTQTIIDNLNLEGACTGPIILQSDENTMQATLHKVNGNVEGQYLSLRDMKADGGNLPFVANNSVDLGNNSDWDIKISDALELYWVGGNGDWSDSLHWSGSSGGDGGYCIPTPIDNVYFDENSFLDANDSVRIDLGNATCHNMNWTGALAEVWFYSPDTNNLRIYGSLKLNSLMRFKVRGPVFFETTETGHSIQSFNRLFISPVTLQGIGGEWMLVDNFNSLDEVIFKHGSLNLNQKTLTCHLFDTNFETARHLDLSKAQIIVTAMSQDAWHLNTRNLVFDGSGSRIITEGQNGLLRTEGGGRIVYNDVYANASSRIYNINTHATYNNVLFSASGSVHGNCTIDTLLFGGSGSIYDSDTINFAHVQGTSGLLSGGRHIVNNILFDENATISGNNSIDSTIIYGAGNISGTNSINKSLVIGGEATISGNNNFGHTLLMDNGMISDQNIFKSLKLSPGNIYEFEEGTTQNVRESLYVRGNNCFPITIRSQHEGQQAIIAVPESGTVSGDFLEIRDIKAAGGATFYAGQFSTDISNNEGWQFANAPGYIYGFAGDTTVCNSDITIIGTQNFNPDASSTFLWHDGSTANQYEIKPDDTMAWVRVSYADDCTYADSIQINRLPSPFVEMGDDIALCQRDTLFALQQSENISYEWMDGSTRPYIISDASGIYGLTVTNEFGCTAYDELYLEVLPSPLVDLGNDTTIHSDEHLVLDARNPGADYYWSTGDTTQSILASSDQTYWVSVTKDGCMASDTIFIGEFPPCVLAVPTAFSPNGDGINDILYVRGSNYLEFELMIFNRWGSLVFTTSDNSLGWDGTYKGKPQPVDAYNYYLKGRCIDGQITSSKGTITLLR